MREGVDSVSAELVREVLDHAPADLTPAELVVLLVIAERSQATDRLLNGRAVRARECFPDREAMRRECRLSEAALSRALQRLRDRGLEVRVPIGKDRTGQPLFARSGQRSTYRLPAFESRPDQGPGSDESTSGGGYGKSAAGRTLVRAEGGSGSGQGWTTVQPEVGPGSGPNRNVTVSEPEQEPCSDRLRDRGQRDASALSIPPDDRSEVDIQELLLEVGDRVHGFAGSEESMARGMLAAGCAVQAIVNTIGKQRLGRSA